MRSLGEGVMVWSNKQLKQMTFSELHHSDRIYCNSGEWRAITETHDGQGEPLSNAASDTNHLCPLHHALICV